MELANQLFAEEDYPHAAMAYELLLSRFPSIRNEIEVQLMLAVMYTRHLRQPDKARLYFDRLVKDAPASGQAPKAKQWLTDGTLPKTVGLGCVGCHK